MAKYAYEHTFIQHLAGQEQSAVIPLDVAAGLNAWGADGWEIAHMEAVWEWQKTEQGACWPETLRGYYVTFKRELGGEGRALVAKARAEVPAGVLPHETH
jgi:hypothetical protein